MIYTHEQMKAKFGTVFVINVLKNGRIEEHFDMDYFPYEKYYSVVTAKTKAILEVAKNLQKEEDRINDLLKDYENLPFFKKVHAFLFRSGHKAHKVAKEVIENKRSEAMKKIEEIQATEETLLDPTKTYEIEYPDIKLGDKIFLVVENDNLVKAGFYEGQIIEVKHTIYNENQVKLVCVCSIISNGTEKQLYLNVNDDGELRDGYSYHSVFLNEEQAKAFSNKVMKEKADFYSSKILE